MSLRKHRKNQQRLRPPETDWMESQRNHEQHLLRFPEATLKTLLYVGRLTRPMSPRRSSSQAHRLVELYREAEQGPTPSQSEPTDNESTYLTIQEQTEEFDFEKWSNSAGPPAWPSRADP